MKMKLTRVAFRNLSRNLRRSILSGSAIAVSALSIVMLFGLIMGMRDDMAQNLKMFYSGEISIRHAQYEQFERYNPIHLTVDWKAVEPVLQQNPALEAVVPRINFPANLYINGGNHPVLGVGADFEREKSLIDLTAIVRQGRIPTPGANEMLIGATLARDLNLKLGDSVTMLSTTAARGSNAITWKVVGLGVFPLSALNAKYVWVPIDRAQYFLRMGTDVQDILMMVKSGYDEKALAAEIQAEIQQATGTLTDVQTWKQLNDFYSLLEVAQYLYYLIGIFFFLLGSTVIINTTMMVIYERMREIGTLSALGMQGSELTRLFFLEGAIVSAIGAAVGVACGVLITWYLSKAGLDFTDAMSGIDIEISSVLYPKPNLWTALFVYIYAVVVSSAATLIPSRRAARIEPVEALRYI
jgi:putative ABC transport system permease protein